MARTVTSSFTFGAARGRDMSRDVPPMSEMNTTPLIDVMLVLLIMFIVTVPMQTHQVEVALPRPGKTIPIDRLKNDLRMSAEGAISWNGQAISDAQLTGALEAIVADPEPPEVHFRPDAAARYERVDEILAIASKSRATTFGFVGNERYRDSF
jgi:biopolymer transport protein ExbD